MSGPRRRPPAPTPPHRHGHRPGLHVLRDPTVAARLVRASGVGPGDLVVEVGAGGGALTLPLARTGARVIAVEVDPRAARKLARRMEQRGGDVRVVEGDLRTVPLPRRPFHVVANVPFAHSTALLRRLLCDPRSTLAGADLLVERGFALRMAEDPPGTAELVAWRRRHTVEVGSTVPARAFSPAPRVDAAHLRIRRR